MDHRNLNRLEEKMVKVSVGAVVAIAVVTLLVAIANQRTKVRSERSLLEPN